MVLSKLFGRGDDRLIRRHGLTLGDAWHDPELTDALPGVLDGDLAAGLALLDVDDPQLRSSRLEVLAKEGTGLLDALEAGMDQPDPEPDLLMWAGATRVRAAWKARSGRWAKDVGRERFATFHETLAPAFEPLMYAAQTSLTPTALDQLQWFGLGIGMPREELDQMWERIVELDPHHHASLESRLQVLCRKWSGSEEQMFAFARERVRRAPSGDRSLVLIVQAHYEKVMYWIREQEAETIGQTRDLLTIHYTETAVTEEIVAAADRWLEGDPDYPLVARDAHAFGSALSVCFEDERAAAALERAGSAVPVGQGNLWGYLDPHPAVAYARARKRLGVPLPVV
ncbi:MULTISPECIES: hypothetical protein [unclassified Nocardiopsis]|uniref:hypothetical protein n=1 Tax=unclassified Nocardiopsis TaxID=2649073 RepID=UPI00340A017F